jgi:hypothetical protein
MAQIYPDRSGHRRAGNVSESPSQSDRCVLFFLALTTKYTVTLGHSNSTASVPPTPVPPVAMATDVRPPSMSMESPSLNAVPENSLLPSLAVTKVNIPLRRGNSLPPYGPGPTQMYTLPTQMPSSTVPVIRKKRSIKKRWQPSRRMFRHTKLPQRASSTGSKSPTIPEKRPILGKTFPRFRRVKSRSFSSANVPMVETGARDDSTDPPNPPVTYGAFRARSESEPSTSPAPTRKTFDVAISEWIDEHFDFLPRPTDISNNSRMPPTKQFQVVWLSQPSTRRALFVRGTNHGHSRPPKTSVTKRKVRRGDSGYKAFIRGWGRVTVFGSSLGNVLTFKTRRQKTSDDDWRPAPQTESTVRRVESRRRYAQRAASLDTVSETFHAEDDIVEAEPLHAEPKA